MTKLRAQARNENLKWRWEANLKSVRRSSLFAIGPRPLVPIADDEGRGKCTVQMKYILCIVQNISEATVQLGKTDIEKSYWMQCYGQPAQSLTDRDAGREK